MKSLISLELRKQMKTFLGLLVIIVICLTFVTVSVSYFGKLPLSETFLSVTVMLQAFGLPFFALLLAGSAGAALRNIDRKAEEDIPARPTTRLLAAYVASLLYLILLATIVFAASSPMRYAPSLQQDFDVPVMMVVLLPLHSAAFAFSYWLCHALVGSVLSIICTSFPAYWLFMNDSLCSASYQIMPEFLISIVAVIFLPFWIFGYSELLVFLNVIPGLIATIIHISVVTWLANRIELERRTRYSLKIGIATVLLISLSVTVCGVFSVFPFQKNSPAYESRERSLSCPVR
jgi:hypothetical protein